MDKLIQLKKFSDNFFIENNIIINSNDRSKIVQQLAFHIEYIVFNVVSMMCLIAIINNTSQITKKTLEVGKNYIHSTCKITYPSKAMMGGMGTASYMGINEPNYKSVNIGSDLLPINFSGENARNQIGGAKVSNNKILNSAIDIYIISILKHHNMTASKTTQKDLCVIIKYHIGCVLDQLKKYKKIHYKSLMDIFKSHKTLKSFK